MVLGVSVYVLVLSAHEVLLCDLSYRVTLTNTEPRQLLSISGTQCLWVLCARSGCVCSQSGSV